MATSSALISVLESNSLTIIKILLHLVFVVMVFMIFVCCLLPFGHRMGNNLSVKRGLIFVVNTGLWAKSKDWLILNIFVAFENKLFRKYLKLKVIKNLGNTGSCIMRVLRFIQITYYCYASVLDPWENVFYAGYYVSLTGIIGLCYINFIMSQYGKNLVNVLQFWKTCT